jgi:hypothetical protein
MPTVLRREGYEIVIYFNDHVPPHVHAFKGAGEVKIDLDPVVVSQVWKMKKRRLFEPGASSLRTANTCWRGGKRSMANKTFTQEYEESKQSAADGDEVEPRAESARYDRRAHRVVVKLRSGASFVFPPELAEGLAGASPDELADVQVTPSRAGLRWPNLDVDYSLPQLLAGVFGTRSWMRALKRRASSRPGGRERPAGGTRRSKRG